MSGLSLRDSYDGQWSNHDIFVCVCSLLLSQFHFTGPCTDLVNLRNCAEGVGVEDKACWETRDRGDTDVGQHAEEPSADQGGGDGRDKRDPRWGRLCHALRGKRPGQISCTVCQK